jgi:hypothetical protein
MTAPDNSGDGPQRRIRFTRRPRHRPPLWPILAALVALVFLIVVSQYLKG